MLNCKDVADRASALIDGELSRWEALQVRMHLAMCKGCSRFIEQLRLTDRLASGAAPGKDRHGDGVGHDEPDGRLAEILSTLREEKQRGR